MTFPVEFHLFQTMIPAHLVFELLAIFCGIRYYRYIRRHSTDKLTDLQRLYIFAAVCFGALTGSRLAGIFEDPHAFFHAPDKFRYIFSNKTIVGGIVGGLFAVEALKKILNIRSSSGDMMVYPILLGIIIGRTGCFLAGTQDGTIGSETAFFTGIDFGDGKLRHPLPLYEILFAALFWISLKLIEKRNEFSDGGRFKVFIISYLIFRLFTEFLKDRIIIFTGLSTIQLVCLAGLAYYYKTFLKPRTLFFSHART